MKNLIKIILLALFTTSLFAQVPPQLRHGYCHLEKSVACEDFILDRTSRWDFDNSSEIIRLQNKCLGNPEDYCLKKAQENLPSYRLKDKENLLELAKSCQLTNMQCFDLLENKLPRNYLRNYNNFKSIAKACQKSDVRCIEDLCNARDLNCNFRNDLITAAKKCYQPCL